MGEIKKFQHTTITFYVSIFGKNSLIKYGSYKIMHVVKCYRCHIVYISLSDSYISNHRTWIAIAACKITDETWHWIFHDINTALTLQQTLMESM